MAERLASLLSLFAGGDASYNEASLALRAESSVPAMGVAALAAVVTIALTAWGYRRLRRTRAAALTLLRTGAVACALALFLEPVLELQQVSRVPNHVAVLVDGSASMAIAEDGQGGTPRAARAAAALAAEQPFLERLEADHRVDYFAFGEALVQIDRARATAGAGTGQEATRLREVLAELRARYAGADLGGVLVLSDGADNGALGAPRTRAESLEVIRGLGVPVHTLAIGKAGLRDVGVSEILADDFAFVRTAARLEAVLRVSGFAGRPLRVSLRRGSDAIEVIKEQIITPERDGELRVPFEFTPDRVGKFVFEVAVEPQPGEALLTNNTRAFALKVIRDRLRVLHVAGRPSWDERFVRGLLKRDPNVDLISFFILRTPSDLAIVSQNELSLIPFPTHELFEEELRGFDLLILQNFNFKPYGIQPYLERIREFVARGGGLAMLGGDLSFAGGEYAGTPVAEVLPVEVSAGEPGDPKLYPEGEYKPRLTKSGRVHPLTALRLDPQENEERWAALPTLEGHNVIRGVRSGATVLATHPFAKAEDGTPLPIITVAEPGEGRSLAVSTDSLWSWAFSPEAADVRAYERFWQNAIRWLCKDPDFSPLRVEADAAEYARNADVTLRLRSPDQPRLPVQVSITIGQETAHQAQVTLGEDGTSRLVWRAPKPGAYRVVARATLSGRKVEDTDVFVVRATSRELDDPIARPDTLRELSEVTPGGRFHAEGRRLDGLTFRPPRSTRVERRREVELFSGGGVLLLAISLMCAEWLLRRRFGYA